MTIEKIEKENDRRTKFRFPIRRELRYKLLAGGVIIGSGTGFTDNVGSGGVAFSLDHELDAGTFVELSISWPALLDDTCPMRLIVFGRVLRSAGNQSVCTIDKYEFRTQARAIQAGAMTRSDSMLLRWADGMRREAPKVRVASM